MFPGHAKGQIHCILSGFHQGCVMDDRTQAMSDRIADHAEHNRARTNILVMIDFVHLLEAELTGREGPLVMERGEGKRCAKTSRQNPRRRADVPHAHADHRQAATLDQLQHAQIVVRRVGRGGDLDDVGVASGELVPNFL